MTRDIGELIKELERLSLRLKGENDVRYNGYAADVDDLVKRYGETSAEEQSP